MSKKGDGKKKGGKDTKVSTPKGGATKPPKVSGPRPASYAPRAKIGPADVASDKAENIWRGYSGLVDVKGMRFRVSKDKDRGFHYVRVESAPLGTDLYGLAGSRVYVTIHDIHCPDFRSPFKEGTPDHERQERFWNFFDRLFREMNLKGVHTGKAEEMPAA